jgi:hypothetical protein
MGCTTQCIILYGVYQERDIPVNIMDQFWAGAASTGPELIYYILGSERNATQGLCALLQRNRAHSACVTFVWGVHYSLYSMFTGISAIYCMHLYLNPYVFVFVSWIYRWLSAGLQ